MARDEGDLRRTDDQVIDLDRAARPGTPPVPGAQWDELHERWERWDEAAGGWRIVGDPSGAMVRPPSEGPVSAFLAGEIAHIHDVEEGTAGPDAVDAAEEEEDDGRIHVIDVDRLAAPPRPVPGAQWNEVVGRWERWDERSESWVEAIDRAAADG